MYFNIMETTKYGVMKTSLIIKIKKLYASMLSSINIVQEFYNLFV